MGMPIVEVMVAVVYDFFLEKRGGTEFRGAIDTEGRVQEETNMRREPKG